MNGADRTERSADTRTAIMEATYRALCSHGYADLTVQSIADEFEKSKAAIHYHYNTKEELLTAFLEYFLDRFVDRLPDDESADPETQVLAIVEALLLDPERSEERDLYTALLEIRAQAVRHTAFREQFTTNNQFVEDLLAESIAEGVEQGVFETVDPRRTARLVLATTLGARVYALTLDDQGVAAGVEEALEANILASLRPEGG
jgi:AcrR family transcriptional regulator